MQSQNLLQDILGADNTVRQRAEGQLNSQRTENPQALLQLFIQQMSSDKADVAQIACVLFKKYFLDNTEGVNPSDYAAMQEAVLQSLDFKSQNMVLLKRKGDFISKVFTLQNKNEQLLSLLVEWAQSEDIQSKQFAMYIFEKQTECHLSEEQLMTYKDSFYTIFEKSMQDQNVSVRVAALRATASFLLSIENKQILEQFKPLTQTLLDTTVDALKSDQFLGEQAMEMLVNLAQTHPQFLSHQITQVVKIVSDIVKMKDFEEGTRSQAAEVVLTLADEVPATVRQEALVKSEFFPALIQMVTECEEDMDAWTESVDDEAGTGNGVYSAGVASIERLSCQMKQAVTLEACGPVISQCLAHQDWKIRQAGYVTSGLITEACQEHMKSSMDTAFQTACAGIKDEHPRVKYAGLICLTHLLIQLKPMAQKKYHAELVPALLEIINNQDLLLKVRTQAVHCLFQFTNGLIEEDEREINETTKSSEIMMAYSEDVFKSLVFNLTKAVDQGQEQMQGEVMNLLNSMATLIEEKFGAYFNEFMPLMEKIIDGVEAKAPEQMRLRARTFESMGYMIESVSDNKDFQSSVQRVTEKLFKCLEQGFGQDDPQELAVKDTLAKTAFYLKEDFHAVAPQFLAVLVKDASVEIKLTQEYGDVPTTASADQKAFNFKVRGMESNMRISMNTGELENKIASFHHILKVAEAMGTSFQPYVATVLPVLQQHMNFTSKALRKLALKTFQHLLVAEGEGRNTALFQQFYELFILHILGANGKNDLKGVKVLFKELFHCMKVISENEQEGNRQIFVSPDKMTAFGQVMKKCLEKVSALKAEKLEEIGLKHKQNEIDEEDLDKIYEDLNKLTGVSVYINECCGIMMDVYGKQVTQIINENVKFYFTEVMNDYRNVSEQELQDASYFFINFTEKCGNEDFMEVISLTNQFCEITMWAKPEMTLVLQNTSYGIGAMAKNLNKDMFKQLLSKSMQAIEKVITLPNANEEEQLVATENAYVTLGVLAMYQTNDSAHVQKFLQVLPLQGEEEAQEGHSLLIDQLLAQNAVLVQPEMKSEVQSALMRINQKYSEDDSILTEEAKAKLDQVMGMM